MSRDAEFMRWFVVYINDTSLEDLKKEPLDWNERMAYLHKKFEDSKLDVTNYRVNHKTKFWYCLTHWEKPNKTYCGDDGISRWHWKNVTCDKCLLMRESK